MNCTQGRCKLLQRWTLQQRLRQLHLRRRDQRVGVVCTPCAWQRRVEKRGGGQTWGTARQPQVEDRNASREGANGRETLDRRGPGPEAADSHEQTPDSELPRDAARCRLIARIKEARLLLRRRPEAAGGLLHLLGTLGHDLFGGRSLSCVPTRRAVQPWREKRRCRGNGIVQPLGLQAGNGIVVPIAVEVAAEPILVRKLSHRDDHVAQLFARQDIDLDAPFGAKIESIGGMQAWRCSDR
mmetsp:Transcript_23707/g.68165  ORF Transcript_23707/g.68165 Transcript_23707/m.68165 type:complete len:240 (-) Transcript_23707:2394-3113(-)